MVNHTLEKFLNLKLTQHLIGNEFDSVNRLYYHKNLENSSDLDKETQKRSHCYNHSIATWPRVDHVVFL